MNLNKNDCIEYNNNNESSQEVFISYVIDSKNKLTKDNLAFFGEELSKYFNVQKDTEKDTSSDITNTINKENNSTKLMNILIDQLLQKYDKEAKEAFDVCRNISFQYIKQKNNLKQEKNKLEECINYLYQKKKVFWSTIDFNIEIIQKIGYILMMTYYKLHDYKICDDKSLSDNIYKIMNNSQNPVLDFFNYCSDKNLNPDEYKKIDFWEENYTKYKLPAIFIFLINTLKTIETVNIYIDMNENITNEDIDFLVMIIYNTKYIFNIVNHVTVNMLHTKAQCFLYSKFFEMYKRDLNNVKGNVKKIYLNLDCLYDRKWDFNTDFLLNEHRKMIKNEYLKQQEKDILNIINKSKSREFEDIGNDKKEVNSNVITNIKNRLRNVRHHIESKYQKHKQKKKEKEKKYFKSNSISELDYEVIIDIEKEQLDKNNPDIIYTNFPEFNLDNNFKLFLLLIRSINLFNNLGNFDLIANDTYYMQFYKFFIGPIIPQEKNPEIMSLIKNFNIIDIISNKLQKVNTFNYEINSLDHELFKKVLESIYLNPSPFISLSISFFSSDVTYLQQSLYKLYNPKHESIFKEEIWAEDAEIKILDKLFDNFCINLQILYYLIKFKGIQMMGFNFDIPDIIENRNRYMIVISKFIVNLLLYITNKEAFVQKCIILAPKIKFNNNISPYINEVLGEIMHKNNNKIIKELSFQVQLYQMINIKNIISESLIILNIGDCDIYTFNELVNYLTSFKFSFNSLLSKLSISLIKTIRLLNNEIYNLLFKIFNIKIKQLLELNIYSNIKINSTKEYLSLLKIFKNNWISSCILTLNEKSKQIYEVKECVDEKNKIKYLVPSCLESQLLIAESKNLKKKDNEKIINTSDDAYWYLKYIFKVRYSCVDNGKKKREESLSKFLANNILSYIFFTKNINLQHNLKENKLKK